MGTLLRARTIATKHGVGPHLVPKTEGAGATICRQTHVDFVLGSQRADLRALHALPRGSTVTSATYSNLLRENLKPAIHQKRRGLLTTGVCLLHDNARPHTATATVSTIEELRFECIPHPPYSPGLRAIRFSRLWSIEGCAEWKAVPRRQGSVSGA